VPTLLPFLDVRTAPEAWVRRRCCRPRLIRHAGLDGVLAAAGPLQELLAAKGPADRSRGPMRWKHRRARVLPSAARVSWHDRELLVRRRAIAARGKAAPRPNWSRPGGAVSSAARTALEAASALSDSGTGSSRSLQAMLVDETSHVDCRAGIALVLQRARHPAGGGSAGGALTSRPGPPSARPRPRPGQAGAPPSGESV